MLKKLSDFNLKGPVKQVSVKITKKDTENITINIKKNYSFSHNGLMLTNNSRIHENKKITTSSSKFKYNDSHELIQEIRFTDKTFQGEKIFTGKTILLYSNEKVKKEIRFKSNKIVSEKEYFYHPNNKLSELHERFIYSHKNPPLKIDDHLLSEFIKEQIKKLDDAYMFRKTAFDTNENIILDEKYNEDGFIISKIEYDYNKKGHLTEKKIYKDKSQISSRITMEHDTYRRNIYKREYNSKGKLMAEEISRFNKNGNEIEKLEYFYFNSDIQMQLSKYKYDEKNDLTDLYFYTLDRNNNIKEERFIPEKHFYKTKDVTTVCKSDKEMIYEFDRYGNWTVKKEFNHCSDRGICLNKILERSIDYYKK